MTLRDHREAHDAKYSLLVAPNPGGKRLEQRARDYRVSMLSAEKLAALCRRHDETPLSLFDYEPLFASAGKVDTSVLDNAVAEMTALYNWANLICRELPERAERHGPMSAREVHVAMDAGFKELSEDDIGRLLAMLSHPLIGVLHRVEGGGGAEPRYAPAINPETSGHRIHLLGDSVAAGPH